MRFSYILIFCLYSVLALAACGKKPSVEPHDTAQTVQALSEARGELIALTRNHLDADTFISTPDAHCDSLLFTSLFLAAGGSGVDLERAKDASGLWERHPRRDCASTISKDMYIGLFTYLWHAKDLDNVKSLIHTGEERGWVMGEGPAGQVVLTPNLIATLYEIRFRLGGGDSLQRLAYSDKFEGKGLTGFEAHLEVLHTLLRGALLGAVTDGQKDRLEEQAVRSPRNVLFQAAFHRYHDGDQSAALALWPEFCPKGRLPTTLDRCDDYLWQRDDSPKDWAACPKAPEAEWTFSGVDCEVAAAVIEGVLD